jgi:hypothetical protein
MIRASCASVMLAAMVTSTFPFGSRKLVWLQPRGLVHLQNSRSAEHEMMVAMFRLLLLAAAAVAAHAQNPLTDAVMARYKGIRQSLIDSAEVMPADAYSFKLTPAQRTFAEWIDHVPTDNYNFCATIKAEKAPDTGICTP